jgi:hypothetical protein
LTRYDGSDDAICGEWVEMMFVLEFWSKVFPLVRVQKTEIRFRV